ncbi:Ger(x)C family spore germination protein [Paenibacillaceae bacterium]|nr:Ger(x)C family spore germination protein [Paenibacillaceae bacterium]
MKTKPFSKRCVLAASMVMLLLLSGCWDNKDINHRLLPVIIAISKSGENYKVYLKISQSGKSSQKYKIISETGKSIAHALDKISVNTEDHVDLFHIKMIVFDRHYAELGMGDTVADFMRVKEISPKTLVIICNEDLMQFFNSVSEGVGSENSELYDFFEKNAGLNPQLALTRLWQVYRSTHSFTRDVAIPIVKSSSTTSLDYEGSAVIRKGKMVGRLSPEETLLFNAFHGESTQGKVEVMNEASVLIQSNTIHNKARWINDTPYLSTKLKLKVVLMEMKGEQDITKLEKELNEQLESRFKKMIEKLQANHTDLLGMGQYFRTKMPRSRLSEWRTRDFPRLQFDVRVDTEIENSGFLKMPGD